MQLFSGFFNVRHKNSEDSPSHPKDWFHKIAIPGGMWLTGQSVNLPRLIQNIYKLKTVTTDTFQSFPELDRPDHRSIRYVRNEMVRDSEL